MKGGTHTTRGPGRILGSPGVFHHAEPHDFAPSQWYGHGAMVGSLCGRTTGIVYADGTLANLFPDDRLCKFCERHDA